MFHKISQSYICTIRLTETLISFGVWVLGVNQQTPIAAQERLTVVTVVDGTDVAVVARHYNHGHSAGVGSLTVRVAAAAARDGRDPRAAAEMGRVGCVDACAELVQRLCAHVLCSADDEYGRQSGYHADGLLAGRVVVAYGEHH